MGKNSLAGIGFVFAHPDLFCWNSAERSGDIFGDKEKGKSNGK